MMTDNNSPIIRAIANPDLSLKELSQIRAFAELAFNVRYFALSPSVRAAQMEGGAK